ncbi:GNAT family N-acetyltransferase [Rhodobacteraceae bacterium D3-12]|nr:GNAT family N-acetyltransferase [Rhodobacteraceae bacterium D3-12]
MSSVALTYHLLDPDTAARLHGAEVFDHAVDPAQLTRFVSTPGHELIFACHGTRVVGFASGSVLLHPDKPAVFFLNEVAVADDMQRRGIATALCQRLLQRARDQGCQGVWLATEQDNAAARALYRALNGRETGDIVVFDWDGAMDG